MPNAHNVADLLQLMARLRDPDTGCPWDRAQDFRSIAPCTLEEVCEVIDAIERDDYPHLREELGDLLFQVVFYAQLGSERGLFDFAAIVDGLVAKLVARHPHVFPAGTLASRRGAHEPVPETRGVKQLWESIKERERAARGSSGPLGEIPATLSALMRSAKVQSAPRIWASIGRMRPRCLRRSARNSPKWKPQWPPVSGRILPRKSAICCSPVSI